MNPLVLTLFLFGFSSFFLPGFAEAIDPNYKGDNIPKGEITIDRNVMDLHLFDPEGKEKNLGEWVLQANYTGLVLYRGDW